jgi:predicted nucleotidyltransferase
MAFYPKDFIETIDGLIFAVVWPLLEDDKVLCFLRYRKDRNGFTKYDTQAANAFLKAFYPDYLIHSYQLDADLHAVARERILQHYVPQERLRQLRTMTPADTLEHEVAELCRLLGDQGVGLEQLGLTGSVLIGAQRADSDIDLVCYSRAAFTETRKAIQALLHAGQLQNLSEQDWQASYRRRDCTLSYADYCWHEQRKYNKALINGRKFDISLLPTDSQADGRQYRKCGKMTVIAKVIDATYAFDYPAVYLIDHPYVNAIVCFTATYSGQAFAGETINAAGILEQNDQGPLRLVIGASREAPGEYLKVIFSPADQNTDRSAT